MKIYELLEAEFGWTQLTDEELEPAFDALDKQNFMSGKDIEHAAAELAKNGYARGPRSAAILLTRMHVAVHGKVPIGYKPNEQWLKISKNLYDFLESKGYNADANLRKMHDEMNIPYSNAKYQGIPRKNKPRKKRGARQKVDELTAKELMSKAAHSLAPETRKRLLPLRDAIIDDIMKGLTAKEAFDRHLA